MTYNEVIRYAIAIAFDYDEKRDKIYLYPNYRYILYDNGCTAQNITDFPDVTNEMICQALHIYQESYNAMRSSVDIVADDLMALLSYMDKPVQAGQQQLANNLVQYMLLKKQLQNGELKQTVNQNNDVNSVDIVKQTSTNNSNTEQTNDNAKTFTFAKKKI